MRPYHSVILWGGWVTHRAIGQTTWHLTRGMACQLKTNFTNSDISLNHSQLERCAHAKCSCFKEIRVLYKRFSVKNSKHLDKTSNDREFERLKVGLNPEIMVQIL